MRLNGLNGFNKKSKFSKSIRRRGTASLSSIAGTSTATFNITCNHLISGCFVINGHYFSSSSGTINSVFVDGAPASLIRKNDYEVGGSAGFFAYIVAVGNKAAGTYTILLNFSAAAEEQAFGAYAFDNVNQSTPVGNITDGLDITGTNTNETATINSAERELVVDLFGQTDPTMAIGAGQTLGWLVNNAATYADAQSSTKPGSRKTTMTWTASPAASGGFAWIVFCLKPI